MKDALIVKSAQASAEEMAQINRYTRREYKPEEVYVFSLVLCDNEIDRDYERFSPAALQALQPLFLGKTCIMDHERKSANQSARIFDTAVEQVPGRVTKAGEPYTRLTAKAYLPRTEKSRELIELIDGGILKEVSVSCSVKRSVCGICGQERCSHEKGRSYGGRLCSRVLEEPQDAYECSFVAVPAQREAGVKKSWQWPDGEENSLREKLAKLEEAAAWGKRWREEQLGEILRCAALAQPQLSGALLEKMLENLGPDELSQAAKAFRSAAVEKAPLRPQLAPREDKEPDAGQNHEFLI